MNFYSVLLGFNFQTPAMVQFGGVNATILSTTAEGNQIVVSVPAGVSLPSAIHAFCFSFQYLQPHAQSSPCLLLRSPPASATSLSSRSRLLAPPTPPPCRMPSPTKLVGI